MRITDMGTVEHMPILQSQNEIANRIQYNNGNTIHATSLPCLQSSRHENTLITIISKQFSTGQLVPDTVNSSQKLNKYGQNLI